MSELPFLIGEAKIGPDDLFTESSWESFVGWFWSKVDATGGPDSCWPWLAYCRPDGYGIVQRIMGVRAHRVALMLATGPIPAGLDALHSCDNPPCCNPRHLRPGTRSENMREAYARGRSTPHPPTHSKITADEAREIRRRRDEPRALLAAEFGLSVSAIDKVRQGHTWRTV